MVKEYDQIKENILMINKKNLSDLSKVSFIYETMLWYCIKFRQNTEI